MPLHSQRGTYFCLRQMAASFRFLKRGAYLAENGSMRLSAVDGWLRSVSGTICGQPILSPDGKSVAFWGDKGRKMIVAWDDQMGSECDELPLFGQRLHDDGTLESLSVKNHELYRVKYLH